MADYRAYIVGSDGHFINVVKWNAPMMLRLWNMPSSLLTATTLSFGSAVARLAGKATGLTCVAAPKGANVIPSPARLSP